MRSLLLVLMFVATQALAVEVSTPAVQGFRCEVLVNGVPTGQNYSQQHTAQTAAINAKLANPSATVGFRCFNEWRVDITGSVTPPPTQPSVTLYWDAPQNATPTKYRVYYATTQGQWLQADGQGIDAALALSYTLTNLQTGQKYYFGVTAVYGSTETVKQTQDKDGNVAVKQF